jgi:hypothetical protein
MNLSRVSSHHTRALIVLFLRGRANFIAGADLDDWQRENGRGCAITGAMS